MARRSRDIDYVLFVMTVLLVIAVLTSFGCKRGDKGDPGADGSIGATGPAAAPLSISVTSVPPGPYCANGGSIVTVGNVDTIICNGNDGIDGAPGIDLTPLTIVQFCPGTTGYPSTFSEIGVCIQGVMYGVYSAQGGFLTQLPPGLYSSVGINSSCQFTIGPNCAVSY